MSLINEALKKAERARFQQRPMQPISIGAPSPRPKPRAQTFFRYVFGAAIGGALFAGALLFLFKGILGKADDPVDPPPVAPPNEVAVTLDPRVVANVRNGDGEKPEPPSDAGDNGSGFHLSPVEPVRPIGKTHLPSPPVVSENTPPVAVAPPVPLPPPSAPVEAAVPEPEPPPTPEPVSVPEPPPTPVPVAVPEPVVAKPPSVPVDEPSPVEPTPAVSPPEPEPPPAVVADPVPTPPASPGPNPDVLKFLDTLQIRGIKVAGEDSKALLDNKVYRLNAIVSAGLQLRLVRITQTELTFQDHAGFTYAKTL